MKAERWKPGAQVDGVNEIWFDPGEGSSKSTERGYLTNGKPVKPGDYVVTLADGSQIVTREVPFP